MSWYLLTFPMCVKAIILCNGDAKEDITDSDTKDLATFCSEVCMIGCSL